MKKLIFTLFVVLSPLWVEAQLTSAQKEQIGFTALQNRLGVDMPTGAGISATMVEAPSGGNYAPNTGHAELTSTNFTLESGASGNSSHATTVARYLAGTSSLSPSLGNGSNDIGVFEANNWLGSGFLRNGTNQLPLVESRDIMNHSWIANSGSATEILRRTDFLIQRDNVFATFGLNNESSTSVPDLMANAFNGMVVGRSDGNHSTGTANVDGTGRSVPHIVVPTSATSNAAPTVASAAAILIETARNDPMLAAGDRVETLKSVLMAGASRQGDHVPFSWSSSSPSQPLDSQYGAGQLNIDRSYDILTAGRFAASDSISVGETGWDFNTISASESNLYFFDFNGGELSASLNWHREVVVNQTGGGQGVQYNFNATPILANLDLRLYSAEGFVLGSELMASLSEVDNVELIFASFLNPGRYAFEVTSDTNDIDYSLAWIAVIPEPGSLILGLILLGACGLILRTPRRRNLH